MIPLVRGHLSYLSLQSNQTSLLSHLSLQTSLLSLFSLQASLLSVLSLASLLLSLADLVLTSATWQHTARETRPLVWYRPVSAPASTLMG